MPKPAPPTGPSAPSASTWEADRRFRAWAGTRPFITDVDGTDQERPPGLPRYAVWKHDPATKRHAIVEVGADLETLRATHGIPLERVLRYAGARGEG